MTALATDAFTRANSTGLGANWTRDEGSGTQTIDISSNVAVPHDDLADRAYFYNAVTWPNDQYSQANVTTDTNSADTDGPCVACRMAPAAATYYRVVWPRGQTHVNLVKLVAGAVTSLSNPATGTLTNGDLIRIEAQGTTIRAGLNGATLGSTATDSAIASGSAGIAHSADGGRAFTWDNWEGGDFASGGFDPSVVPWTSEIPDTVTPALVEY